MKSNPTEITQALLAYGETLPPTDIFPVMVPEAAELIVRDPYAFCIGTCLDRGARAEVIWTIPYDMKNALGHLDPYRIYGISLDALAGLFACLPRKPRYPNAAPRTIRELTNIVVERCGGDASRIWVGKSAVEVQNTFCSIHGVGPGIASMAVLLIEKAFAVRFEDHWNMDIKPDIHTVRVLYRLGASQAETVEAALAASRQMNPAFPGIVDWALWNIGRNWCRSADPDCEICPVSEVCEKRY
ncbi:MAG: hypothetical protein JXB85_00975 [Anaerolineales bacterium]|nr:hypothetical protein [Anaerolineales bacterium]